MAPTHNGKKVSRVVPHRAAGAKAPPQAGVIHDALPLGPPLPKTPTGIDGLDEVTGGGLPTGRSALVTGAAGSGKTLLGLEFLIHGALEFGEPGVLLAFEESASEIAANVRSLGFDLEQMEADGQLVIDAFSLDPSLFVKTGAFDLEGLFIRMASAVDSIGAKRVVLDTIEVLFGALDDHATVRAELGRLFRWLKDRGLTAIVTGERGPNLLTRHGIEEYVSDCVIVLDHRVQEERSTRRLRIVKYRGSLHGTNEYPFLITHKGIVVLPLTSLGLGYGASSERFSTGVDRLDHMLQGGIYRGTTMLISGEAGTGKTTLAAKFLEAACARGERGLFVSLEESPSQLVRNMASVGIDLRRWMDAGSLAIWAGRPASGGIESHLATMLHLIEEHQPTAVAIDAMTAFDRVGDAGQVTSAMTRDVDMLKARGITTVVTSLSHPEGGFTSETSGVSVTSLMDTWLLLRNVETAGERNRLLFVRKSRGTAHSNQVREFVLRDDGISLLDVYVGPKGVLTGAARLTQESDDRQEIERQHDELDRQRRQLARRQAEVEAQIGALRASLGEETTAFERALAVQEQLDSEVASDASTIALHRWADAAVSAVPDNERARRGRKR